MSYHQVVAATQHGKTSHRSGIDARNVWFRLKLWFKWRKTMGISKNQWKVRIGLSRDSEGDVAKKGRRVQDGTYRNRRSLGMLFRVALLAGTLFLLQSSTPSTNAIARLQQKIDAGEIKLQFDEKNGYLRSLLSELKIPVESQILVYSKTSFQRDLISPG